MNTDNEAETLNPWRSQKPKTVHLEMVMGEYDPYDHEALANEPC